MGQGEVPAAQVQLALPLGQRLRQAPYVRHGVLAVRVRGDHAAARREALRNQGVTRFQRRALATVYLMPATSQPGISARASKMGR